MLSLEYIRMIWDYNYWGHHQIWESLMTISKDDFERSVDYGIGSLHNHAVHTMWAEALWLARIQDKPSVRWEASDFPERSQIIEQWQLVESDWREFVGSLTEDQLNATFDSNTSTGTFTHTIGETLIHVANHSTDHRAQMLRLIGDYGGETFEQDIIFYLRAKQSSE